MNRIKGFDGLRALAFLAVFFQHYSPWGLDASMGSYGVWLFFGLSGFLIVRNLHADRLKIEAGQGAAPEALGRFFWRRAVRIAPTYYLVLGVFALLGALGLVRDFRFPDAWWFFGYASNIYFGEVLQAWTGRFGYLWSLAVEEQFYLLAAPALLCLPARWAKGMCAGVALAAVAQNFALRAAEVPPIALYCNSLLNFGVLAFGGWVGLRMPKRPRAGTASWPTLVCLGGVVLAAGIFWKLEATRETVFVIGVLPILTTAILGPLALANLYRNQESRLARALEWAPLAYLGRISYGLYLYHNLPPHRLLGWLSVKLGGGPEVGLWTEAAFSFLLALILASLSWVLIEKPLLAFKDRPPRLSAIFPRIRKLATTAA